MQKKSKVIGIILIVLMIVSSVMLAGCKKEPSLRGQQFVLASWHGDYHVDTYVPRNEDEEFQLEYRRKIQQEHGFTMWQEELAGWDDYFQAVQAEIMSGNRKYVAYWLSAEWAMTLYKQNLLAPVNQGSFRLTNREPVGESDNPGRGRTAYNAMMENLFTFGGSQYAFSIGVGGDSWQGNFVFWNKRLLSEAGLEPDLPYDMQAAGTWTWEAYRDLLTRTTQTVDGITTIFGMPCDDSREVVNGFVYGNGANWVTIDSQGVFHNGTQTPAFIEALQYYQDLMRAGLMKPRPEDAAWDWDFTEFFDGRVAFLIAPEWRKGQMPEMRDDYGCVMPPIGPRASGLRMSLTENVVAVPSFFSQDEVDTILRAIDLWHVPSSDDWKQGHYWAFRDRRAVDETVTMTRDSRNVTYRNFAMVPGFNIGDFIWDLWEFPGAPAQLMEQHAPRINALLDDMNR